MNKEILTKVAETIVDEPFKFTIIETRTVKKWWQFKPKTIESEVEYEIRSATLRTMVRCSKLLLKLKRSAIPEDDNQIAEYSYSTIQDSGEILAEIIATAIHNQRSEVPMELVDTVLDGMNAVELENVAARVINKLHIAPFINCITSIRGMQILENEENPVTEEIIASGQQSAA